MTASRQIALSCLAIAAVSLVADGALHDVLAQNPFVGPRAAPDTQVGGIVGWLLMKQSEFYREMSSTIRAAKADGSAVWTLLAISFAYGIFHAAGPGHGKTVISSYLVANEETARRGIVLSFVSALVQSLIAVLIVGIGAWLLDVTAKTMCGAERLIEIASYTLIAAFGIMTTPLLRTRPSLTTLCRDTRMRSVTIMAMSTTSIADIPMVPSPRNLPVPAAGGAVSARFSPSASGHVRAPFWFWCSRWLRGCSGPASPPRLLWGLAPRSPLQP
jgi:hypothetical protein